MTKKFFNAPSRATPWIKDLTPRELAALLSGQELVRDEVASLDSGRVVQADGAIYLDLLLSSDRRRLPPVRKLVAATPDASVDRHRIGQGRRWVRELARALGYSITPTATPHEFLHGLLKHGKGQTVLVRHYERGRVDILGGVS